MTNFVISFPLVAGRIVLLSVFSNFFLPLEDFVRGSVVLYLFSVSLFGVWLLLKKTEPLEKTDNISEMYPSGVA
ncbi:MAG: hypothetical protein ABII74_07335 [Elusimicrobiota bacterium]